jgi:hypothetical protein
LNQFKRGDLVTLVEIYENQQHNLVETGFILAEVLYDAKDGLVSVILLIRSLDSTVWNLHHVYTLCQDRFRKVA